MIIQAVVVHVLFFVAPVLLARGENSKDAPKPAPTCLQGGTCEASRRKPKSKLHKQYHQIIKTYSFQPVINEYGQYVNIILVRAPFRMRSDLELFERYKDEILFLGLSSFEDFPLPSPNPYSPRFPPDAYVGRFPGFLHMFREPERIFPAHVKLLLMSQSDFALPRPRPKDMRAEKVYDFTFSGSDQDVHQNCKGWSSYAKNWTFVKQALRVMCGEYNLTGVLVATKDKANKTKCAIPKACRGKMLQTPYLPQDKYFEYLAQGKFAFLPQVHDASPRVTTQALIHNVPLLMNKNIVGGWKYITEQTGEFFNDMSDFRQSLEKMLRIWDQYTPRAWVLRNYGDEISGARLNSFIVEHFKDRVKLPKGTKRLFPTGA